MNVAGFANKTHTQGCVSKYQKLVEKQAWLRLCFFNFYKISISIYNQFMKPVQFIIYCTIQLSSSRLIRSAPWPLGWLYLPSLLPGSLFRTSVSLSCAMPDGRGLGPRTAVQIPCLLCGACPRSSWFHFIIGLVRYSIFLLVFGTSE